MTRSESPDGDQPGCHCGEGSGWGGGSRLG